jgi:hypothetical protein
MRVRAPGEMSRLCCRNRREDNFAEKHDFRLAYDAADDVSRRRTTFFDGDPAKITIKNMFVIFAIRHWRRFTRHSNGLSLSLADPACRYSNSGHTLRKFASGFEIVRLMPPKVKT